MSEKRTVSNDDDLKELFSALIDDIETNGVDCSHALAFVKDDNYVTVKANFKVNNGAKTINVLVGEE